MITAHRRGVCVVAVYTKDVAETKATAPPTPAAPRAIRCCSRPSRRNNFPVARMERSAIRDSRRGLILDCAALHPGYKTS